jgi:hypothetical protein
VSASSTASPQVGQYQRASSVWVPETRSAVPKSLIYRPNRSFGTPQVVDLALARFRIALSGDFEFYAPVSALEQLVSLRWLE